MYKAKDKPKQPVWDRELRIEGHNEEGEVTDTLRWSVDGGHHPHLNSRGGGGHTSKTVPTITTVCGGLQSSEVPASPPPLLPPRCPQYPSLEEATEAALRARQGKKPESTGARGSGKNYFESAQGGGRGGVAAAHEKDFAKAVVKAGRTAFRLLESNLKQFYDVKKMQTFCLPLELRACMFEAGYQIKKGDLAEMIAGLGVKEKTGEVDANEILQAIDDILFAEEVREGECGPSWPSCHEPTRLLELSRLISRAHAHTPFSAPRRRTLRRRRTWAT